MLKEFCERHGVRDLSKSTEFKEGDVRIFAYGRAACRYVITEPDMLFITPEMLEIKLIAHLKHMFDIED